MTEAAAARPARSAIERLLRPRSVAVVGASVTPGALSAAVLGNLDRFGFAGDIHLVNANRKEINGKPCLASTADLPPGVDCAVLAIPRAGILEAVKGCAARGVGAVIIFSAGFAEAGADGHALQEQIARIARDHGMAVEGPNCLGFINNVDGIALTFGTTSPEPLDGRRGVGIVSQSGAMATVLHAALRPRGIAVSHAISTGNEAVNGIEDFIDYLLEQDATKVITMIADQIRDPRRFLALAERARAAGKPIVLLHPGRSAAARASAQTHTGAMTGDYDVMRALVAHAGVALVDTLEELLDVSELMIRWPVPPRSGAAVISDSGVFKAMALDFCETVGLDLPAPSPAAAAVLGALAPGLVLPTNPLDTTAQPLVDPQLYRKAMRPMLDDDRYGSLVLAIIMSSPGVNRRKVQPIIDALREWKPAKPVMFAMLGEDAEVAPELIAEFRELGVPYFRSPERALRALARLTQFAARQPASSGRTIERASARLPAGVIPEHAAKALLKAAGIPVPNGALVTRSRRRAAGSGEHRLSGGVEGAVGRALAQERRGRRGARAQRRAGAGAGLDEAPRRHRQGAARAHARRRAGRSDGAAGPGADPGRARRSGLGAGAGDRPRRRAGRSAQRRARAAGGPRARRHRRGTVAAQGRQAARALPRRARARCDGRRRHRLEARRVHAGAPGDRRDRHQPGGGLRAG